MTNRLVNYNILGKEMKRFIILSVTILIVFGLFSCKNIHRYGCGSRDRYTDEEHYDKTKTDSSHLDSLNLCRFPRTDS